METEKREAPAGEADREKTPEERAQEQARFKQLAYERRRQRREQKRAEEEAAAREQKSRTLAGDERYMREAICLAEKAAAIGEVPIGCVIVKDGQIVGRGYNRRTAQKSVLGHAEIAAIRMASEKLSDWRLSGCTIYVTLEPCQMCAGACVQARIDRAVIGAMNPKAGCAGSILNLFDEKRFNHQIDTTCGVLGEECAALLRNFFLRLRTEKTD